MNIQEILSILACPECHGDLTIEGDPEHPTGLSCATCRCVYPIRDDIPILLRAEAIPFPSTENDQPKADAPCACS